MAGKSVLLLALMLLSQNSSAITVQNHPAPGNPAKQVIVADFRLFICTETAENQEKRISHPACGDSQARVLYQDSGTLREGHDRTFTNKRPLPLTFTVPEIQFVDGRYQVMAQPEQAQAELATKVLFTLSDIVDDHVRVAVAVHHETAAFTDVTARKETTTYINPAPLVLRTLMTARHTFKLGDTHTLSDDLWVEALSLDAGPASSEPHRLWLEVTLK